MVVEVDDAEAVHARTRAAGFNLRAVDSGHVGLSLDERTSLEDVEAMWRVFANGTVPFDAADLDDSTPYAIPAFGRRQTVYPDHPIFSQHHSETEMLRYLRRLQHKDIALDRSMIALGSCTMKLNATAEMIPVTWPEFANVHPFAPLD